MKRDYPERLRALADRYPIGTRLDVMTIGHATVISAAEFRREVEHADHRTGNSERDRENFLMPAYGAHFEDRSAFLAGGAGLFKEADRIAIRFDYVTDATRGVPESYIMVRTDVKQPPRAEAPQDQPNDDTTAAPPAPSFAVRNSVLGTAYELRNLRRHTLYTGRDHGWRAEFRPVGSGGWLKKGLFPDADYTFYYAAPPALNDAALDEADRQEAHEEGYSEGQRDALRDVDRRIRGAVACAEHRGARDGRIKERARIRQVLGL